MLSIHLTLAQVVAHLGRIAKNDPDRIGTSADGGCVYATNDNGVLTPVCIVGQMFADLGLLRLLTFDPSDLNYPNMLGACSVGGDFWGTIAKYGITADSDAQEFMHSVQRKQDDRLTWGEAYDLAVVEYRQEQQEVLEARLSVLFG